jgi:hypothetical protein
MGRGIDSLGSSNDVPFEQYIPMLRSYHEFVREGLKIVENVPALNTFELTPNQVKNKTNSERTQLIQQLTTIMIEQHWKKHLKIDQNLTLFEHIIKNRLDTSIYKLPE